MSTGAIVAIVIVAVLVVAALVMLPRLRKGREQRELERQRSVTADRHRSEAQERTARAEAAEQLAQRERAEAGLHESRAQLHEQGLADHELDGTPDRDADGERGDPVNGRERTGISPRR
jgi:hypothetical protein